MTAVSGIVPQSVGSVIDDLLLEFSIERSLTNQSHSTLSKDR